MPVVGEFQHRVQQILAACTFLAFRLYSCAQCRSPPPNTVVNKKENNNDKTKQVTRIFSLAIRAEANHRKRR